MKRQLAVAVVALGLLSGLLSAAPAAADQPHLSSLEELGSPVTQGVPGATYAFSSVVQGKPVRWNPCAPIHWKYRTSGQVPGGFSVVLRSVQRIAQASGTTWIYDGSVSTAPSTTWLPRSRTARIPVLIGWTSAGGSDLLRGQPASVLGVARTVWFGTTRDGTTTAAIRGAVVALDHTDRLPLTGPLSWSTVIQHELTHAMGLSHVQDPRQLMNPMMSRAVLGLQPGDLAGLRKVGGPAGCVRL